MKKESYELAKAELEVQNELFRNGTIDKYTCADVQRMAEERLRSKSK